MPPHTRASKTTVVAGPSHSNDDQLLLPPMEIDDDSFVLPDPPSSTMTEPNIGDQPISAPATAQENDEEPGEIPDDSSTTLSSTSASDAIDPGNLSASPAPMFLRTEEHDDKIDQDYRGSDYDAALVNKLKSYPVPAAADPTTWKGFRMIRYGRALHLRGTVSPVGVEPEERAFVIVGEIGWKSDGVRLGPAGNKSIYNTVSGDNLTKAHIVLTRHVLPRIYNDQAAEIHTAVVRNEAAVCGMTEQAMEEVFIARANQKRFHHALKRQRNTFAIVELVSDTYWALPDSSGYGGGRSKSGGIVSSSRKASMPTLASGTIPTLPHETVDNVELALNKTYPLSWWPGIDKNPQFELEEGTRIRQLPFYGTKGELIAPWHMAEVLRPGTVVVAQCSLVMWRFNVNTYHVKIRHLDVVDYSFNKPENHTPEIPKDIEPESTLRPAQTYNPNATVDDRKQDDDDNDAESPNKRRKVTE
ncbi:hypothetical protein SISNIDRAFT_488117 [Sistotremastrum niveocremeum HHB9708]|uniref:Uncharacterized protein n=1 Tax=Sistotremastrum niveocremeum HHB9708 TaxID=1314777 RepID=A0A164RS06_9AGAM|nr:hypothetical protein SISNIDRAFT_488117 [Sistotremastrum niveocremeum HHB9708]